MADKKAIGHNYLRSIALTALLIGTMGSLYFMIRTGSNQKSVLLIGLFAVWVLSPFVGLMLAFTRSKSWSDIIRSRIYWTMIVISIISLTIYSGVLTPSQTKPAFNFLVVPCLSWFIVLTVWFLSIRHSRENRIKNTNQ